jgi:hypothetical protein
MEIRPELCVINLPDLLAHTLQGGQAPVKFTRSKFKEYMSMFKRKAVRNTNEDYCPVVQIGEQVKAVEVTAETAESYRSEAPRTELFVLAANIYFRARRNTRARAAGII